MAIRTPTPSASRKLPASASSDVSKPVRGSDPEGCGAAGALPRLTGGADFAAGAREGSATGGVLLSVEAADAVAATASDTRAASSAAAGPRVTDIWSRDTVVELPALPNVGGGGWAGGI